MNNSSSNDGVSLKNTINDNVLTIKTVQISPVRILLTAIKDIIHESNITFQADGMRIISMDKSHTIIVHLHLHAQNFEFYECKKEKIVIGVNMVHLFKLITSIDNNDILTIYIENSDYVDGFVSHLSLNFANNAITQSKTLKLKLLEPDSDELEYPDIKFSTVLNLPSTDFQKIIRDSYALSDKIEIKSVGNEILFNCSGQFATSEIYRAETSGSIEFITKQDATKIVQGEFSLKNLSHFIKCTNLCSQIELYLENDKPIIVKYNVASLGEIKLCLAGLPSSQ
jgi:proliferating cell nuclear antigen